MNWTLIPIITGIVSSTVAVLSFLLTVRYQHTNKVIESMLRQRSSLRDYSTKLIDALQKYGTLEILYLNERYKIDKDLKNEVPIAPARSAYVYGLKDELAHKNVELEVILRSSKIEISKQEFPETQRKLQTTFTKVNVVSNKVDSDQLDLQQINLFELEITAAIKDLVSYLATVQEELTTKILEKTLTNDIKKVFHLKRNEKK